MILSPFFSMTVSGHMCANSAEGWAESEERYGGRGGEEGREDEDRYTECADVEGEDGWA